MRLFGSYYFYYYYHYYCRSVTTGDPYHRYMYRSYIHQDEETPSMHHAYMYQDHRYMHQGYIKASGSRIIAKCIMITYASWPGIEAHRYMLRGWWIHGSCIHFGNRH